MRYVLRNQNKIRVELGGDVLKTLKMSISEINISGEDLEVKEEESGYDSITIRNYYNKGQKIEFYIVSEIFDVRILAFKRFINSN